MQIPQNNAYNITKFKSIVSVRSLKLIGSRTSPLGYGFSLKVLSPQGVGTKKITARNEAAFLVCKYFRFLALQSIYYL